MVERRLSYALRLAFVTITPVLLALPLLATPGYATDSYFDDLHGPYLNSVAWSRQFVGGDVGFANAEADGLHLGVVRPGTTLDFGVVVRFAPTVTGDFDAAVDFRLPVWPTPNGARMGWHSVTLGSVERVSRYPWEVIPGEVYLTNFIGQGLAGVISTTDMQGRLRLTRFGSTCSGYRWDGASWVLIGSYGGCATSPLSDLALAVWFPSWAWSGQPVEVVLENFSLSAVQITPLPPAFSNYVLLPLVYRP